MAWRDHLRTASFRGIEFKVEAHDAKFGRRQVTHEFAQRDEPFTEDLGRKAREFNVDAYLIGDDYPARRDRLIAACETAGPGELVHPYLGHMQAECMGLTVRESSAEGRMCRLQLTFVEAGQAKYPSNAHDAVRAVTRAANRVADAARRGFLARFLTDGYPSFVIDAAGAHVRGFSSFLTNQPINPVGEAQTVAGFFDRVGTLASNAVRVVTAPSDLAADTLGIIGSIRDVFGARAAGVLRSLREANELQDSGAAHTPNRAQQQRNYNAFSSLIRHAALAQEASSEVIRAENSARAIRAQQTGESVADASGLFQTQEDAMAARDALTDAVDMEAEDPATATEAFDALTDLRTEIIRGIPSPQLRLPSVARITPAATLPSLVVSYQFYGTAARAVEIAQRNQIPRPGFLPGHQSIEVLTDAG